jgi:hypothetical protein
MSHNVADCVEIAAPGADRQNAELINGFAIRLIGLAGDDDQS